MAIDKALLDEIFSDDSLGLIDSIAISKAKPIEELDFTDTKEREVREWIERHGRQCLLLWMIGD